MHILINMEKVTEDVIGLNVKYVNIYCPALLKMDQKYKAITIKRGRKRQQIPKGKLTTKTEVEMK